MAEENTNPEETKDEKDTTPEETQEDSNIEEDLASRLEESETEEDTSAPVSETPQPAIDITKLSVEELQVLKSALDSTPDRPKHNQGNQIVKIRKYEGKYVLDFKNAYLTYVEDASGVRKVERHMIPILLEGEKEFTVVPYRAFMQSDQISCKVTDTQKLEVNVVEGETTDDYNRPIEMVRTDIQYTFVVRTPEGEELSIKGKIANA